MRRTLLPRKFFNNKGTILLILTFFILATSALFASDYFFNIVNIKIVTSGDRVQIRGIEQFKNKNLLFMSIAQTQRYLIENNPQIKSFNIEKKYPDTLEIKITHEEPNAQLKANEGYFILSDLGKIIRKSVKKNPDLPVINYYQKLDYSSYESGEKINYKDILTGLHFNKKTHDLGLTAITIDINGLSMIALNLDRSSIFFTTDRPIKKQEYQLESIIKQFKIQGREFKTLDLRFDKPVIKF